MQYCHPLWQDLGPFFDISELVGPKMELSHQFIRCSSSLDLTWTWLPIALTKSSALFLMEQELGAKDSGVK
ncbi:hypothetical protein VNO77_23033 [Canavalia gladiata]|uniref:Uncharacterized protein n=1 Tax=Canavalia gladiata TaxID=3824 RepID=A0AAN9L762_CANGL